MQNSYSFIYCWPRNLTSRTVSAGSLSGKPGMPFPWPSRPLFSTAGPQVVDCSISEPFRLFLMSDVEREKALKNIAGLSEMSRHAEENLAYIRSRASGADLGKGNSTTMPRPQVWVAPPGKAINRIPTRPRQENDLLNEHEVAGILAVSVSTIRRWRLLRRGPKFIKVGASVRYKPADVHQWLESRESGGEHR